MIERSIKISEDDGGKGVTLAQLRQFVEQTADLDPDLIPTAKVSAMAARLQELAVSGGPAV
jgi:hypothetical protein